MKTLMKYVLPRALVLVSALLAYTVAQARPTVQSWYTAKGAKVMFVNAPGLPMVDVRVVFDAGSARDGDLPGLALFSNAMLTESAGPWSADDIAERLDNRGIDIGSGSLRDMAWVNVRSLVEARTLAVALETLAKVVSDPKVVPAELERVRQQMQVAQRRSEQSPSKIASREFYQLLYGGHPYAHKPEGTPESLLTISRDDILGFHRQYYVARNAVIAIVGDVSAADAAAMAEQITAGLPRGKHAPPLPEPAATRQQVKKETYPSSQTHVYMGQLGTKRHDPDYFALYVGNHVLGGSGLVSTLAEEVRNKRGLSYSVYSYFSPMRAYGPFLMGAQTKNAQAEQAIQVMRDTLKNFVEKGPSEAELKSAKQNITGGFPLQIASNKKIVSYIAMMGFYDLPLDWLDTLVGKVEAVTIEQVRDAFRRRVQPDQLVAVIVGGEAKK